MKGAHPKFYSQCVSLMFSLSPQPVHCLLILFSLCCLEVFPEPVTCSQFVLRTIALAQVPKGNSRVHSSFDGIFLLDVADAL